MIVAFGELRVDSSRIVGVTRGEYVGERNVRHARWEPYRPAEYHRGALVLDTGATVATSMWHDDLCAWFERFVAERDLPSDIRRMLGEENES